MENRIVVSTGDPLGVGPEIAVAAASKWHGSAELLLVGDAAELARHSATFGVSVARMLSPRDAERSMPIAGGITCVDFGPLSCGYDVRKALPEAGRYQLGVLRWAADYVRSHRGRALVTGPVSKAAVTLGGTPFLGHTEFLAEAAGLAPDDVSMLFIGPRLHVGLVTTHLPLRDVPGAVTAVRVQRTVLHVAESLMRRAVPRAQPLRILVGGVNPHAGEGGLLGREDDTVIAPALASVRTHPLLRGRVEIEGPLSAETALRRAAGAAGVGVVAMYHDQATIASKLLDWGEAVNVTWGLPFVRTSVDHGVAYDIAGAGAADAAGLTHALELARRLAEHRDGT